MDIGDFTKMEAKGYLHLVRDSNGTPFKMLAVAR